MLENIYFLVADSIKMNTSTKPVAPKITGTGKMAPSIVKKAVRENGFSVTVPTVPKIVVPKIVPVSKPLESPEPIEQLPLILTKSPEIPPETLEVIVKSEKSLNRPLTTKLENMGFKYLSCLAVDETPYLIQAVDFLGNLVSIEVCKGDYVEHSVVQNLFSIQEEPDQCTLKKVSELSMGSFPVVVYYRNFITVVDGVNKSVKAYRTEKAFSTRECYSPLIRSDELLDGYSDWITHVDTFFTRIFQSDLVKLNEAKKIFDTKFTQMHAAAKVLYSSSEDRIVKYNKGINEYRKIARDNYESNPEVFEEARTNIQVNNTAIQASLSLGNFLDSLSAKFSAAMESINECQKDIERYDHED